MGGCVCALVCMRACMDVRTAKPVTVSVHSYLRAHACVRACVYAFLCTIS